jgi:hypothetical protein
MNDKLVGIWLKKDVFYLEVYSQTTDGIWTSTYRIEPYVVKLEDIEKLGKVLMEALGESQVGLPPLPLTQSSDNRKQFLSVVKVKSEKDLMKTAKKLFVNIQEENVTINPYKFNRKYMEPELEKVIESKLDPERLTQDVLKAFELEKV